MFNKGGDIMKGVPRRDGSGKGRGANKGRGGCKPTVRKGRKG